MPLPSRPTKGLRDPNQETRDRETFNRILGHQHDDWRIRTPAEVSSGVTPVNYAFPPGDVRRYGLSTELGKTMGAAFNAAAINKALTVAEAAGGGIVDLPAGDIPFDSTLFVGTRVFLRGKGKGYGVSSSTVLRYTGAGIGIQIGTSGSAVNGFYSGLSDFALKNDGTGTIGIRYSATHGTFRRLTITAQSSTGWSTAAILTDTAFGTYTLRLTECYIADNAIGFDCHRGQDFKLVNCYFERNGTNVRIGGTAPVIGFAMFGGVNQLLGPGYAGDTNETNSSVGVDVVDCRGFHYAGVYGENNGGAISGAEAQRAIVLRTCRGGSIVGSNFFGAGSATGVIHLEDDAEGVHIAGNTFVSVNGYAVTYDNGAKFDAGINYQLSCTGVWNKSWTPSPTNLTVSLGGGSVAYSGTWDRKGDWIEGTIRIASSGGATTASTANSTYFAIGAMMPAPVVNAATVHVMDDNFNATYENGCVFTSGGGRIYLPTWAASSQNINIHFRYLAAEPT